MKWILVVTILACMMSCKSDNTDKSTSNVQTELAPLQGLKELDDGIAKNPENANLYFQRAKLYYDNEGFQEAKDDVEQAISLDSSKVEYFHLLADCYFDNFKSMNALGTMIKSVRLFPESVKSKLKLSEYYFILKKYEQSIQTAGSIISEDPQNAEAYFMMGMNFRESGDEDKAINSFQLATENDPELTDAWLILGSIFEKRKNPLAVKYYDGALAVDPDNITALHAKAYYLQNNEEIPQALELYQKIMLLDRNYTDAPLNVGILYLELDSVDKAYQHFNILTNNVPENPLGYFYRGITNEMKGNLENAKGDYESALRINPEYTKAREALNSLQAKK